MDWYHTANAEWLIARKQYLTASDFQKIIPITASGRPRTNLEAAYLKVWAEKNSFVLDDNIVSRGPMARGHILEPFAITEFNKHRIMPWLYHWDDIVIHDANRNACSPDALNIKEPLEVVHDIEDPKPEYLGEVKAYDSPGHYAAGLADKMKLEERWQIATSFVVMPSLKVASLILFNPNTAHPLFHHEYTSTCLADEIEMIKQAAIDYDAAVSLLGLEADAKCTPEVRQGCVSEQEIIDAISEVMSQRESLNP